MYVGSRSSSVVSLMNNELTFSGITNVFSHTMGGIGWNHTRSFALLTHNKFIVYKGMNQLENSWAVMEVETFINRPGVAGAVLQTPL